MEIPYAFKNQGYGLSCRFSAAELSPCSVSREEFHDQASEVLQKYGIAEKSHPYETWDGELRSVYIGSGGQWLQSRSITDKREFSLHNIDTPQSALACSQIVGIYLSHCGVSIPYIQKEGVDFAFHISFSAEQHEKFAATRKGMGEHGLEGFVERHLLNHYNLDATLHKEHLTVKGDQVAVLGQAYTGKSSSPYVALATFHALGYFLNYALDPKTA